ncbi:hypothetical protein pb186bvf_000302 [Paramecium bursaria]
MKTFYIITLLICATISHKVNIQNSERFKSEWPELIGMDANLARTRILQDDPKILVQLIAWGSAVTEDYSQSRVRIFYNPEYKVAETPRRG